MVIAIALVAIAIVFILLVRFQKRGLARFHGVVTNRITTPFARGLPGFGVITSVGRRSGKRYRTPVNVFQRNDGFVIALTYGRESGWVKNVLANGGCQLETRGQIYQLSAPRVINDPERRQFPAIVRLILGLMNANHFMQLTILRKH